MTLLEMILLKHGWRPEQLEIEQPERTADPALWRFKGRIDSRAGRVYSQKTERIRETANGRRKQAEAPS